MRREHSMFGLLVMLAPVAQAQPVDGAPAERHSTGCAASRVRLRRR